MRQGERGFTFIEVLVVMGIIAVLAGMTVFVVGMATQKTPAFKTDALVKKVAGVVGQLQNVLGQYPPSDPKRFARVTGGDALPSMPNGTNVGIETLYQVLYAPVSTVDPKLGDDEVGNTDEDEFDRPTGQGKKIWEIIDAWGNPLVYFANTDYASADQAPPTYVLGDGTPVNPRPWKYADESRGFVEPRGYQVFSMGEDGVPNTRDDVKAWE